MINFIEKTADLLNKNEYKSKMEKEPAVLSKTTSKNEISKLSKLLSEYENKLSESDKKMIDEIFEENS